MPKFRVTERCVADVYYTYEVEAEDAKAAQRMVEQGAEDLDPVTFRLAGVRHSQGVTSVFPVPADTAEG